MAGIVPPPPAVLIGDVRAAVQQHVDELVTRQCQGGGDSPLIPRNQEGGTRGPSSVPLAAGIFGPALLCARGNAGRVGGPPFGGVRRPRLICGHSVSRDERGFAARFLLRARRGGGLYEPWAMTGGVVSVSLATRVRLIFAGWLPQDGLFGWSVSLV